MATATHLVQLDLAGTAFGGTPVWTDVTRFVRMVNGFEIDGWRQDEHSRTSPSTVTLTFDNDLVPGDPTAPNPGRFTPGLSTSPWTGRLVSGVHVRISETVGGTTYQLFDGYVLDWNATVDGSFPIVTAPCTDILGWWGTREPLRSVLQETILLSAPPLYVPLTGDVGSPSMLTAPSGAVASMKQSKYGGGSYEFNSGTGPVAEGLPVLTLTPASSTQGYVVDVTGAPLATTGTAGGLSIRVNWAGTGTSGTIAGIYASSGATLTVGVDASGNAQAFFTGPFPALGVTAAGHGGGTVKVNDGLPHDFVVSVTKGAGNAVLTLKVDDVTFTDTDGFGTVVIGPFQWTNLQAGGRVTALGVSGLLGGSFSHLGINGASASSSDMYHAGADAFAGERTDQRATRLLSWRANTGSVLDVGQGAMGLQDTAGKTMQDALLDVGDAEGGIVFADGQGRVTLFNRARLRNPVSVATFDTEADLNEDGLGVRTDSNLAVNEMVISRPGGGDQRVADLASQAGPLGVRQSSATLAVNSDRDAADAAGWVVANGKDPNVVRPPTLAVDVLTCSTAKAQAALARVPLERVTVSNVPSWAPALDAIIEGRTIRISDAEFTVSFFSAPVAKKTLRADAAASANTKLDNGLVFAW